jgi:hypothetical protein
VGCWTPGCRSAPCHRRCGPTRRDSMGSADGTRVAVHMQRSSGCRPGWPDTDMLHLCARAGWPRSGGATHRRRMVPTRVRSRLRLPCCSDVAPRRRACAGAEARRLTCPAVAARTGASSGSASDCNWQLESGSRCMAGRLCLGQAAPLSAPWRVCRACAAYGAARVAAPAFYRCAGRCALA